MCMQGHHVRWGTANDIAWIVHELRDFSDFYGTELKIWPGEEVAQRKVTDVLESHVCFVSENGGELTGFIMGLLVPHYMNESIMTLTEAVWWVPERFRGTRAGYLLLKAFTDFGKQAVDWIHMTTELKVPVSDTVFEHLGYRQMERGYLLESFHGSD